MERILLSQRLDRLAQDHTSDPDIPRLALQAAVDVPIGVMLRHESTLKKFAETLGLTPEVAAPLTFGDVAVCLSELWESDDGHQMAIDAMWQLSEPYFDEKRRRISRGKN